MTLRRIIALLALATGLASPAWGLDVHAGVDPLAKALAERRTFAGFVVGILKDGQTQVLGYGEVTRGAGVRPDGDTVYEIGSVTKTFTGILLSDLVVRGAVKLEQPVQNYLPSTVHMPVPPNGPITLRHLITHTSGLPRRPDNLLPKDPLNPYGSYTIPQLYTFLNRQRAPAPTGAYVYSNLALGLVSHVMELQTGKPYADMLAAQITGPLGLTDTRTVPTPEMLKRLAPPYGKGLALVHAWDFPTLAGAGGIRSTVHDLLRYAQANLKPDGSPLGKAIAFSHQRQGTRDAGKPIAMAWRISGNGRTLSHTGATGGYRAWLSVVPGKNLGVVVLGNGTDGGITWLGDQVTLGLLQGFRASSPSAAPPAAPTEPAEPAEPESEEADPAEGK